MLAAYAASYPDQARRLILADWLEERGDARAAWLRDDDLWHWLGPDLHDPTPPLVAALATGKQQQATRGLVKLGMAAVPALYDALVGEDWNLRERAVLALAAIAAATPALAALIERLQRWD